jgi:hypothetical protein
VPAPSETSTLRSAKFVDNCETGSGILGAICTVAQISPFPAALRAGRHFVVSRFAQSCERLVRFFVR